MLLSRNLLNKINPKFASITNEQLQKGLNAIGIEVESIFDNSNIDKNLQLVKIIEVEDHPDSDHLHICTVQNNNLKAKIVCGAKNLVKNVYALLAPIGYMLPNGITIKERKIRGVVSEGMLCGYNELNPYCSQYLSNYDLESIIMAEINENLNSSNFIEYFNLNDIRFELSIPSNRNELNGLYFIAYELNTYFNFNTPLIIPEVIKCNNCIEIKNDSITVNEYGLVKIKIEKHDFKYDWSIKKYLINVGVHSTNFIVDLGNLITYLFATPIHMFDADKVSKIEIVDLKKETNLVALDSKEYKLYKDTVIVKNNNEIISAIGLIGSKKYAIDQNSTNIYIEFVNLNNSKFIKYAKLSNINSNSKNLFLKPISSNVNLIALYSAYKLIFPFFKFISDIKCIKSFSIHNNKPIDFDIKAINSILGVELENKKIIDILNLTGNKIENKKIIPTFYRLDLINIYDIAEEILKTIDINNLKPNSILFDIKNFNSNDYYKFVNKIKNYFVNFGFIETKTYNLTSQSNLNKFNLFNIDNDIELSNPSSIDRKYLRHNIVVQMLDILFYNINHKQEIENIFEVQKIQFDNINAYNIFNAIICSPIANNIITKENVANNIYTTYNIFYNLVKSLNLKSIDIKPVELNLSELIPFAFEIIFNKKKIGYIAQINPLYLKTNYKYSTNNTNWFIINFNIDELYLSKSVIVDKIKPISEFNPIYKEITFENPNNLNLNNIVNKLYFNENIETINLYDFYKSESKSSYTISIKIQSYKKTLNQDEISKIFNKCLNILESNGLIIRR